jgi:hypothetical protein
MLLCISFTILVDPVRNAILVYLPISQHQIPVPTLQNSNKLRRVRRNERISPNLIKRIIAFRERLLVCHSCPAAVAADIVGQDERHPVVPWRSVVECVAGLEVES